MFAKQTSRGRAPAGAVVHVLLCDTAACLWVRSDPARRLHAFAIDDLTFNANADLVPRTPDDCKEDAWTKFHVDGVTFTNQGDCVSFVETLGKTTNRGG